MLDFSRVQNYFIACGYTDMRKQIDGLTAVVELQFGQKLDEASIFLFCGRQADRIKALYWNDQSRDMETEQELFRRGLYVREAGVAALP